MYTTVNVFTKSTFLKMFVFQWNSGRIGWDSVWLYLSSSHQTTLTFCCCFCCLFVWFFCLWWNLQKIFPSEQYIQSNRRDIEHWVPDTQCTYTAYIIRVLFRCLHFLLHFILLVANTPPLLWAYTMHEWAFSLRKYSRPFLHYILFFAIFTTIYFHVSFYRFLHYYHLCLHICFIISCVAFSGFASTNFYHLWCFQRKPLYRPWVWFSWFYFRWLSDDFMYYYF